MSWAALFEDLEHLGASAGTRKMLRSYLVGRKATFKVEVLHYSAIMKKGCPQGSRIGPLLWNAGADNALKSWNNTKTLTVAYADDLAVLVGAARIETAKSRMISRLDELIVWANKRGLSFSTRKTQLMCLKGGKKPGFTVQFGTTNPRNNISATSQVIYLGIILDYKKTFWPQIVDLANKGTGLFSKLRGLMSANWGVNQSTRILYKAVYLPKLLYAADIWAQGAKTKKARRKLESVQKRRCSL